MGFPSKPYSEDIKISKDESVNHTFYFVESSESPANLQEFEFVNMGPENGIKITYTGYGIPI